MNGGKRKPTHDNTYSYPACYGTWQAFLKKSHRVAIMNTQQRIEALERELAALKAQQHCLLPEPTEHGYCLTASFHFNDVQDALDYSKAVETMLMLRRQEGSCAAANKGQYVICARNTGLMIEKWFSVEAKTEFVSPCFATKKAAQAAIENVGADRIMHMFNTFHGVK